MQKSSVSVGAGRLGQVVIESCSSQAWGGSCFGIEVWTDTAKLTDMVIARLGDR